MSKSRHEELREANDKHNVEENVDEDDLCPICHLLLYQPVTTQCKHTLCESCMAHWADVSVTSQMTIVSLDDEPTSFNPGTVEAKCPMCRTPTSASLDADRNKALRERYPKTFEERRTEEGDPATEGGSSIETLTLYIGNTHRLVTPQEGSFNQHDWTFFVRPSRTDIIEEVHIFLHPTFRPPRVIRTRPPYEIRRLGWGYFTITAHVILKAGYQWLSDDAEAAPDGAEKGLLPLDWTLSFDGRGCQGRCRLKVRSEEWVDESEFEGFPDDEQYEEGHAGGRWVPEEGEG